MALAANKYTLCNASLARIVNDLDMVFVKELRNFKVINPIVLNVLYCLCIVLNEKPDFLSVYKLLRDPDLLTRMKSFDIGSLTNS